ncbi:MAG: beta-propeller fold lactonase family protein [Pyrinomonadaceae bacterium]
MKFYLNFISRALLCLAFVFGMSVVPARAGYLYVLSQQNGAPNQIYCFKVNETTGTLVPAAGFPVSSGGNGVTGTQSELLTIDRASNRLYAINKGSNTVGAFTINTTTGALTPMPFSPLTVVTNAVTIAVHPTGSPLVVGGNTGTPLSGVYRADSFDITSTTATQAAGSPFNTGGARPFSSVFSRDGNYYYVGGALSTTFAGLSVDTGTDILTTLPSSPYNVGSPTTLAYATDTQGRLFTANRTDGGLRVFTTSGGVPTAVSGSPFATSFTGLTDGVLSPNEQFYVVADSSGSQVASYQISGAGAATTLSQVGSAPSNGSTANTIAFNQTGTLLYAANSSTRNISRYSFNTTTGAVTLLATTSADSAGVAGFLAGMDYLPTLAPTAASVPVSGRVVTAKGQGIAKVTVTLTDSEGNVRIALTNPFGYYRFDNVSVGETYIISAASKRYSFAPAVINVSDELSEVNFSAQ